MYKFNKSKCPRCHSFWNDYHLGRPILCVSGCGMSIWAGNTIEGVQVIKLTFEDYSIFWGFNGDCNIQNYKCDPPKITRLGWLPFDITLEQLKIYLTFQ